MSRPKDTERESEAAFLRAWLELLDEARDLRARGERAGFPIPAGMQRITEDGAPATRTRVTVPRMPAPTSPPRGMKSDWIWVPVDHAATQVRTVIKAILKAESKPVTVRKLIETLASVRPGAGVNEGTVANIGTSLVSDAIIVRDERGWFMKPEEAAPELRGGYLFGAVATFSKPEVAWFRRAAILHLLGLMAGGLQAMQIVEHLNELEWVPEPKGKETVQADLDALQEERAVRRVSHSKKWVLQDREGGA